MSDAAEGQVPGWFREQLICRSALLEPSGSAVDNTGRREAKRSRKASGGGSRSASLDGREEAEEGGSVLRVKLQICDTLYHLLQGEPSTWRWHSTLRTAGREQVEGVAEVGLGVHAWVVQFFLRRIICLISSIDSVEVERDHLTLATGGRPHCVHVRCRSVGATDSDNKQSSKAVTTRPHSRQ